ncbi:unnamed protein product [Darwinula stevensoni]|uniref:NADP-dependent oxidoreductase domain-containing protein n=1 Tax=Darwinula stevensoni TaxID=69355 RepID=A0A7R8XF23_9CRUS|nr:unnamed protein product [Darwinula stevensoni]CAG0890262.1 unnamed protein product [Darwinula stevensoni]
MVASKIPVLKLNNGKEMPILGLGTWKSKPGEVEHAVRDAIDLGYRHIDGAIAYKNEEEVAEGIKAKIQDGTVKREDLFLTTKCWNTYHRKEMVVKALRDSLKRWGIDYIDLYLIHWPMGFKEGDEYFPKDENGKFLYSDFDYLETWEGMEECVDLGLAKSIGLSNFNSQQVDRVLAKARIKPVVNQVECTPWLPQNKLLAFCKERGIQMVAYSPLGSPDRPWAKPEDPTLINDPKVKEIASKYGKSPAQVLIRFQVCSCLWLQFVIVQRGIATIPKSVTREYIQENMEVFDFELSADDMTILDGFDQGGKGRICHVSWYSDHPYFPFHIEF